MTTSTLSLQDHVIYLLNGDGAHIDFEAAIKGLPVALRGKKPQGAEHSPWQILEHLRIAQADILGYLRDVKHQSPEFPAGYWPKSEEPPSEKVWNKSADEFRADQKAIRELIINSDLVAPLHGMEDQTIMRKLLMLADHNSYHLGEMVTVRRALGAWQK